MLLVFVCHGFSLQMACLQKFMSFINFMRNTIYNIFFFPILYITKCSLWNIFNVKGVFTIWLQQKVLQKDLQHSEGERNISTNGCHYIYTTGYSPTLELQIRQSIMALVSFKLVSKNIRLAKIKYVIR